ncbi:MAG: hypothetical protein Q8O79_03075 [Pseudomonadota bacterium]|nr:hypothetical protein [Pseudomonadota bacterium]
MPDPHKTLAPLIEPMAPPALPAGPDFLLPALSIVGALLLLALAVWLWRRGTPLRKLHQIARLPDTALAAEQLAAWVRAQGIQPAPAWQAELDRLRFGPPQDDAAATLARLCQEVGCAMRTDPRATVRMAHPTRR